MKTITFIDTEVSLDSKRIADYGAIKSSGEMLHESSLHTFKTFLKGTDYICGHNLFHHDLKYLLEGMGDKEYHSLIKDGRVIDTLYLSALLFPQYPYHKLVKDDKLQADELNNPLNDAKKAMELFYSEAEKFKSLPTRLKKIYYTLLKDQKEFGAIFSFLEFNDSIWRLDKEIKSYYYKRICSNVDLTNIINKQPIELAYCLALIEADDDYSITPPWLLIQYPQVNNLIHLLRGTPCLTGCEYCNDKLDIHKGLKTFFNYDEYRVFEGVPLQERAVQAAVNNKSLLAIFPTGGGKSITFQVPALMAGKNTKGLTVVISPLQSLMKDQVDNLEQKNITEAVTINGLLNPIERAKSFERVQDGKASILYISPESLRSRTIEKLLLGRKITRFVIDEAHCFSAWGQDFRVDYLYIAEFIKNLCKKKNLEEIIPVSCFTATAKQNVIEDIKKYFKVNLGIEFELFTADSDRKNLTYKVIQTEDSDKYNNLRNLLEAKKCPTIIYVSRTRRAEDLSHHLFQDGFNAKAYHGKMDKNEKSENQDAFIKGDVDIMVATSAFGMGVDKKDVGMVIHFDISDSLENYVQEAGRAGRDLNMMADCYVLFNEEDLNKHFVLLNQTKITMQEIQQIWKAIKDTTRKRSRISNSALEIAREAGWDENVRDIETRVKTAIAALETAGYIKRGQNIPHIYADSIQAKSVIEAKDKIIKSKLFSLEEEEKANRIIQKLISTRSRKQSSNEIPESRVDYISDHLGIDKVEVIDIIQKLREARVLTDAKDLTIYVDENNTLQKAMNTLNIFSDLENFLLKTITMERTTVNIKELNELAEQDGLEKINPDKIKRVLNYWAIKQIIKRETLPHSSNHLKISMLKNKDILLNQFQKRWNVAVFVLEYLEEKNVDNEHEIIFSVLEIKDKFEERMQLLGETTTIKEVEEAIFYLFRIGALKIEGGFLVTYNSLSIERLERDNKIRYKVEDYKELKKYYEQKSQMIHIVGEYAKKMMEDYQSALQFVDDYFKLEYSSFLRKYFKGSKGDEIQRNITPQKFRQLFGELSPQQLKIINDKDSQYIVVAAGPGSGKTRILVHKLASLILMEDVKHEQLLMLTFSRAAATEFKKRLIDLIGNAAYYVEIKTFHSYCFDLLGKVGNLEKSQNIVAEAAKRIENGEVEPSKITKTVLVIDEAQDMDEHEFRLIQALMDKNDHLRVIAVGDDDQNIYSFRGSDSKYMQELLTMDQAVQYEQVINYRSRSNLIDFTNEFVKTINNRMKVTPILPNKKENGKIDVIRYNSNELIIPAVNKIITEGISGSTCILTHTNEEALKVTSLLNHNHIHAKLIQGVKRFSLYDLMEIRYFISKLDIKKDTALIREEIWEEAITRLKDRYNNSKNYSLCERLIRDFESINKKYKYVSDFIIFLRESQEEDFYDKDNGFVTVSTIHKSKGWEFDQVIIILNDYNFYNENDKRTLYVGMTRAKEKLIIHYNGDFFENLYNQNYGTIEEVYYKREQADYPPSNFVLFQLGHDDVYLSYFYKTQSITRYLMSGYLLKVDEDGCFDQDDNRILLFSKKFINESLKPYSDKGYHFNSAIINYIFLWKQEDLEKETLVVLPEIKLAKTET